MSQREETWYKQRGTPTTQSFHGHFTGFPKAGWGYFLTGPPRARCKVRARPEAGVWSSTHSFLVKEKQVMRLLLAGGQSKGKRVDGRNRTAWGWHICCSWIPPEMRIWHGRMGLVCVCVCVCVYMCVCVCTQSHPTVCDPVDCSRPGSSVSRILQARILEWVDISFSRGSSRLRDQTQVSYVSCIGRWIVYQGTTWEAQSGRNASEKEIGLNLPTRFTNHQQRTVVEKWTPRNSQPILLWGLVGSSSPRSPPEEHWRRWLSAVPIRGGQGAHEGGRQESQGLWTEHWCGPRALISAEDTGSDLQTASPDQAQMLGTQAPHLGLFPPALVWMWSASSAPACYIPALSLCSGLCVPRIFIRVCLRVWSHCQQISIRP